MIRTVPLFAFIAGLVLMLHVTPSLGQPVCVAPGCNPTVSDGKGNAAGGTGALQNVGESGNCGATAGCFNTAFGLDALGSNTTGSQNTASGTNALGNNTRGNKNTATGFGALQENTTGLFNTATGVFALFQSTTGSFNTATGFGALQENTTGRLNTATGSGALTDNTTGSDNTATGRNALGVNTTGDDNTATGGVALLNNTTGSDNTATGFGALFFNQTGIQNTAMGTRALGNSTGNKNIGIGFEAGVQLTSGSNNIYLDNVGGGDESQTMRLGNTQTRTFIAGIVSANVSGATVEIDANGQLGVKKSSARDKRDIAPMGSSSEKVLALRPVTFAYKDDSKGTTHYGLIAEQVVTVYPELVTRTATGEVQTVKYQELIPMLLNELQRQQQTLQGQAQALQNQQEALLVQAQALQRQQQELAEMSVLRKEMAELRALAGQGRETASLAR